MLVRKRRKRNDVLPISIQTNMKKSFLFGIFILLFSAVITVQIFYDSEKSKKNFVEPVVLQSKIVKAMDLGLHNAAADFFWLTTIQYFGTNGNTKYQKLNDYLELTTNLDPKFSYPYAFGTLILPSFGDIDQGLAIGQKGIDNGVQDYKIPYYMATTYHINKDDRFNAAKYFDLAANTPGAPDGIKRVAANYGSNSSNREKTKQIWIGIYESSKDEVVKERAKNYIIHIEILDLLDQASDIYYKINKKYPVEVTELVDAKIINTVPIDPLGFNLKFDENGKTIIKTN